VYCLAPKPLIRWLIIGQVDSGCTFPFDHAVIRPPSPNLIKALQREELTRMRKVTCASLGAIFWITAFSLCGTLSGCGDTGQNTEVTASPEAKKADTNLQNGMKDFMQSKGKPKASSK
jgi:hypothetical protein